MAMCGLSLAGSTSYVAHTAPSIIRALIENRNGRRRSSRALPFDLKRKPSLDLFAITPDRGFLPSSDPSFHHSFSSVPAIDHGKQLESWEQILSDLPKLLAADYGDKLRRTIESLPNFPHQKLLQSGDSWQLWKAMLLLSFIAHAYVWCRPSPATSLPSNMAASWVAVATELDVPPILSYATYNLLNWRRLDAAQPIELGNIVCSYNFYGGLDEEWFRLIHIDIEAKAAPGLQAIRQAQLGVFKNDPPEVKTSLICMAGTLQLMQETLLRMGEKCDPYIYYHRIRRFMSGWRDNPDLPDGLLYGTDRKLFYGETGAQSAIIPAFDAALNVVHPSGPLSQYLQVMRHHMPSSHKQYLSDIERGPSIRDFVSTNIHILGEAYDECLHELFKFRSLHRNYAYAYIKKPGKHMDEKGTGGTDFMPYLRQNAATTKDHLILS